MSILDRRQEESVGGLLIELMEETGYMPEEFIPGLVVAAKFLARGDPDTLGEIFGLLDEEVDDEV